MEIQIHELSEPQLEELSDKIVSKIMNAQDKKRKAIRSNAYHNTILLLKNYKKLKKHCEIVENQVEEEFTTMWNDWRFDIDSLLEHKAKTAKLMKHVDHALEEFKKENFEDYEIIQMKYLLPRCFSDEFIASHIDVDRTTVGRRIKRASKELAVILFGIDVVVDWM
ncbi:hypothetical protein [Enterococcus sp. AZ109]|uniref:hypothetical protein n=1 Tax=Enterococcus sp. AZ109 TaxID=2774634 RepID=UPI003F240C65